MKYQSLSHRFGQSILVVVGLILLLFCAAVIRYDIERLDAEYEEHLDYVSEIAQVSLPSAVWNVDQGGIDDVVEALMMDSDMVSMTVFSGGRFLTTKVRPGGDEKTPLLADIFGGDEILMTRRSDIVFEGDMIGNILIVMSTHRKWERITTDALTVVLLGLILLMAITAASIHTTRKFVFRPLGALEKSAALIAGGNLETRVDADNEDEIGHLARSLDTMRESIKTLFAEISEANRKLEDYNLTLERRVAERTKELQELNELKNRFLGMAAHDLRNPITSIRGMSQMIMQLDLGEDKEREFLTTITTVSSQMLTLLNDLLDISAIESGKFDLKRESGDLSELLLSRVQLMQLNAEPKGIRITTDLAEVGGVRFDHARITQVVDNLLGNAVKFSPPGAVIETAIQIDPATVGIVVRDRGPGIPPDELDRLFAPFEKLSALPTGGEKSTGLGLAIVKRIVDAHDGQIDVQSTLGEGSTFTVSLPRDAAGN